jgi:oxygen-independent coproporphyrinogen-3 oxidase
LDQWEETLCQAVSLQPEHLSVYGLILEPNTLWGQLVEEGKLLPADDELALTMYNFARVYLHRAGYEHYEISNFARPGFHSKHNCRYWLNQDYLGLGPAASSWCGGKRWTNFAGLAEYISRLQRNLRPVAEETELDLQEEMVETVLLGLRLLRGIDLQAFCQRFGMELFAVFPEAVRRFTDLGLLEEDGGYLRLTAKGLPLANFVWQEFV